MTAVFADTSFFVAAANPRDADHATAIEYFRTLTRPIVTTEYVIVETGNWLSRVGDRPSFLKLLDALSTSTQVSVIDASRALFADGVRLYRQRPDKDWSMTDCLSFAAMQARNMHDALTADRHFQQAGFRAMMLERP